MYKQSQNWSGVQYPLNILNSIFWQLLHLLTSNLVRAIFQPAAHRAIVTPLIKKPSLAKEVLKNYRQVSNLGFVDFQCQHQQW